MITGVQADQGKGMPSGRSHLKPMTLKTFIVSGSKQISYAIRQTQQKELSQNLCLVLKQTVEKIMSTDSRFSPKYLVQNC